MIQRLAWHFDFHSHRNVRIGHDPDPEGIARVLAQGGIEEIITFAKCHNGFAYYPTRVGTAHPRMKGDPFGEVLRACRARGIKVLAYVSFGIDGEAGRRHPSWIQIFEPGVRPWSKDHFISVCPFTSYLDQKLLPEVAEIIARYRPDGFFFDTMSALYTCYCPSCRRAFRQASGHAIPVRKTDSGWGTYGRFRHDRGMAMLQRVGDFITARLPGAIVGFNQVGSPPFPERMPASIRRLTLDFPTSGPQSYHASLSASYGSTASQPADVMPTRFIQGWGDWSPSPASALEAVGATILAHGARLYMGDRLHPANRLSHGTAEAVGAMHRLWKAMKAESPPADAQRDPSVLLLHGPGGMYGEDMRRYALDRTGLQKLEGAHRIFLDAGCDTAAVAECYLENWLAGDRLLVIPEMPSLEPATNDRVERFLQKGGRVLVVGRPPRVNGRAVSWLGVRESKSPWQDHLYLPAWQKGADPVLVRGDCHEVRAQSAQARLRAIPPYDLKHGIRFGWGIGPAADRPAKSAVLSATRVGKGTAWHLACPLFSDYVVGINFPQLQWLRGLMRRLQPSPASRLVSEFGNVELITYRNRTSVWMYLVNHGGEQFSSVRETPWRRAVGPLPPYPVTVWVRGTRPSALRSAGRALPFRYLKGQIQAPIVLDQRWKAVRIDWA